MRCGISTSCLYPLDTLQALRALGGAGIQLAEVFLNTFSELDDSYIARLQDAAKEFGVEIPAVHPFCSSIEGFLFTSGYAARTEDGVRMYRRYFEAAKALGADKLVFHGDWGANMERCGLEEYVRVFEELASVGREYGVALCQENVVRYRMASPENVCRMRQIMGNDAAFVLDLKQARRAGGQPGEMLRAMGDGIRHVHISGSAPGRDCLPPAADNEDWPALIEALAALGYGGDLMIEVYGDCYEDMAQLVAAQAFLETLLAGTR